MGSLFSKRKKKKGADTNNKLKVDTNGNDKNDKDEQGDSLLKVLTIGDSGVGKSSLILRFADNVFAESYIATIGSDFKTKMVQVKDRRVKLQVWDTAGQERFRTITSSYYRGAQIILVCYDTTKADTFHNIPKWLQEVQRYAIENVTVVLLGCKSDLKSEREVSEDEAKEYADNLSLKYAECSAKDGNNIEYCFNVAIYQWYEDSAKRKKTSDQADQEGDW